MQGLGKSRGLRASLCAAAIAMAFAGAPALAQQSNVSIQAISSAPYPFAMTAAPTGGAVAWVYNERGARNVWVGEPGADGVYASRRVTAYEGDLGVDIPDLAWTGDGRTLVYTRGGDGGGRTPVNPTSSPAGPKAGQIWAIAAAGGQPRLIGDGVSASPSPKGDTVVFLRGGQPFVVQASGGEPAPLFKDRGALGEMVWSPDGGRLAFVSNRGNHSLVGVYDFAAKSITWISPSIDRDGVPVWSPNGDKIAFVRQASGEENSQGMNREGLPWEIWVSDAATGQGKPVWRAKEGVGSKFRNLFNGSTSLFWGAGDTLVFPWEVTGWVRLYSIPAAGGEARLLTPGQSEVFAGVLSADRKRVIYAGNEGDLDHRHIWEVAVSGGPPKALSKGASIEDYPVVTADDRVLSVYGTARYPLQPALVTAKGMVDIAPKAIPADFPAKQLIEPQLITFKTTDGMTIHAQLFVPPNLKGKKAPALLFFHGGPTNRQTFAGFDSFETHNHLYEANQFLAANGYVVLSVNFRGGSGYGLDYREAKGFGIYGGSELNDIVGGAEYLLTRPEVDGQRMGIWGGSYGGRMTSLGMAAAPKYFVAGVDYAGVHDMSSYYGRYIRTPEAKALALQSSAIGHVDTWKAPVKLMVGDADALMPDTVLLAEALRKRGVPVEQMMIPDEVHFLLRHQSWHVIFQATKEYLDRFLKP
jgi:dipeptidyl aminopeptidase/acylaminoacyl peptidase